MVSYKVIFSDESRFDICEDDYPTRVIRSIYEAFHKDYLNAPSNLVGGW